MDEELFEWRAFRWTRWGPARVVVRRNSIEATVGDAVVQLDLTDRRTAVERQAEPGRSLLSMGLPVSLGGTRVATVTTAADGPVGLLRRQRIRITGDGPFVLPGMELTSRGLPDLLTLRSDAGILVSSRRWAAPLNMAVTEWSIVREHDLVPPRVARGTRDEHVALWAAMKEAQRT